MPVYEYLCKKCQHQYEKREGFDAPAVQKCPNCGGRAQRMIHAPPIVFKGSGFYITDSRKSSGEGESSATVDTKPDAKAKADSDAKPDTSSSSEATSEAKPAKEAKAAPADAASS